MFYLSNASVSRLTIGQGVCVWSFMYNVMACEKWQYSQDGLVVQLKNNQSNHSTMN